MFFVTGGSGFIGSNLAAEFSDANEEVVVCDWFGCDNKWKNLSGSNLCDIINPEDSLEWLCDNRERVEAIIHMGAISSTTETDVDFILKQNFSYSKALWRFSALNKKSFIYASSASTYGDGSRGFDDSDDLVYLNSLRPLNPYGWSKHLFDCWAVKQATKYGFAPPKWAGLKFFNVYGPNEYHKGTMRSMVAKNFENVFTGQNVQLFRSKNPDYLDGDQMRDFVYVKDCVSVISWLIKNRFQPGLYNVASGESRSWNDLINTMGAALGVKVKIEYVDMPHELEKHYQYYTFGSVKKLMNTGFDKKLLSIEDGVSDFLMNYMSKEWIYR